MALHDGHAIGDAPFAAAALEMIDAAPRRHEMRRRGHLAGENETGLAIRIVADQVAAVVQQAVLAADEAQRRPVGKGDESVRRADETIVVLDRVIPVAGTRQFVVDPVQPARIALQHLPDLAARDQFPELRLHRTCLLMLNCTASHA